MRLSPEDLGLLFISLAIFLFTARLFGEIFIKLKLPAVIGEILAGILLGPTLLGSIFIETHQKLFSPNSVVSLSLDTISQMAIVMLLLVSGLEVDLNLVFRQGKNSIVFGAFSLIIPFSLGFLFGYNYSIFFESDLHNQLVLAIFFGIALGISALPVIARILLDLNLLRSDIGIIILSSAMFIDLFGWMFFSLLVGSMKGDLLLSQFAISLFYVLLFALFSILILRKFVDKIIPNLQSNFSFPGGILNFIFILCFSMAFFSEFIGVHAIFGAFLTGIAVGNSPMLKENVKQMLNQFITNIFAPLFFISIGIRVDFTANFNLLLTLIIFAIGISSKYIAALMAGKILNFNLHKSWAIGSALNARGAMEIILGLLALEAGLINEQIYVSLVIFALVTSVITPIFMKFSIQKN